MGPQQSGNTFKLPHADAINDMPKFIAVDKALLKLYETLKAAGSPLYLFDQVVDFIELHGATTFKNVQRLNRHEALLKRMKKMFPSPEPVPITVHLEHKTHGDNPYARHPEDTVTVQSFPFQATLKEYLLNVFLFGNVDNLVNKDDPFGMYNPKHSLDLSNQELPSSFWYHKTYK